MLDCVFFFFQAEDGIRDTSVTGVQTCALPILQHGFRPLNPDVAISDVPNSPWNQNIPGVEPEPAIQATTPPDRTLVNEVIRLWQRAN